MEAYFSIWELFRVGSVYNYNAISVQLQLQLPTGTELGKSKEYVMLKTVSDLSLYDSSWDANGGDIFVWGLVPPVAIAAAYILVLEKDNRGDCDTLGPSKYR